MFSLHHTKYTFILKRLYASKVWTYKEATSWQQSFQWQNIPKEHVSVSFSRSSGPGGQNVNKVSTKVDLRLFLSKAEWIPDYAKENLRNTSQLKKSRNDELIFTSDKTRSQAKNIQDCYEKLEAAIKASVSVAKEPDQATLERIKHLQKIQDNNRKDYKKKQSKKKSERRSKGNDY